MEAREKQKGQAEGERERRPPPRRLLAPPLLLQPFLFFSAPARAPQTPPRVEQQELRPQSFSEAARASRFHGAAVARESRGKGGALARCCCFFCTHTPFLGGRFASVSLAALSLARSCRARREETKGCARFFACVIAGAQALRAFLERGGKGQGSRLWPLGGAGREREQDGRRGGGGEKRETRGREQNRSSFVVQ